MVRTYRGDDQEREHLVSEGAALARATRHLDVQAMRLLVVSVGAAAATVWVQLAVRAGLGLAQLRAALPLRAHLAPAPRPACGWHTFLFVPLHYCEAPVEPPAILTSSFTASVRWLAHAQPYVCLGSLAAALAVALLAGGVLARGSYTPLDTRPLRWRIWEGEPIGDTLTNAVLTQSTALERAWTWKGELFQVCAVCAALQVVLALVSALLHLFTAI